MPVAAVVDGSIFCCHGGIPRYIDKVEILESFFKKPISDIIFNIKDPKLSIIFEILWNDPVDSFNNFYPQKYHLSIF